jgi:UDP-glucose 4-epimerase
MRALVTGGNGFLGHYIVKELLKKDIAVVIFDIQKLDREDLNEAYNQNLKVIVGDVRDEKILSEAMQDCDLVFHTAAIADIDEARRNPVKTLDINVIGTTKCLDVAKNAGVKRFIYASSVYTAGNKGSIYRISKQAGEALCKTFHEEHGLDYTILRYGSLYGSESNSWNPIYTMCKALLTTGEFTYVSPPDSEREYIYIRDAARETASISVDPRYVNKTVMITGHQRIKVRELFSMIEEIIGKEIKIHYIPNEAQFHYVMTPYSFEAEVPLRVSLSSYVDVSEGILDCLKAVQKELDETNKKQT